MAQDGTPIARPSPEALKKAIVENTIPEVFLYPATAALAATMDLQPEETTEFGLSRQDGELMKQVIVDLLSTPKGTFDIPTMHRIFGVAQTFRQFYTG